MGIINSQADLWLVPGGTGSHAHAFLSGQEMPGRQAGFKLHR